MKDESGRLQAIALNGEGGLTDAVVCTLQQYLGQPIEGTDLEGAGITVGRTLGSLPGRVAIAYAQDAHRAADGKCEQGAGIGDEAFLLVLQPDVHHKEVTAIGVGSEIVGRKDDAGSLTGGFHLLRQHALAGFVANGFHLARTVDCAPRQVPVFRHGLAPEALTVYGKFHFIAIAIDKDIDAVAHVGFGQVPMGQDVEYRLVCPP